jgi:hypothetical protein
MSISLGSKKHLKFALLIIQKPWVFGWITFVVSLIIFVPFSRLGVDSHHDGIMFSSANFVAHGLSVQNEVYAQYGPISTWIQAIGLQIFGPSLLVIRIASAVVLAISCGLFAVATRRLLGFHYALMGIAVWVSCTPFFDSDLQMLPWSSDYFVLLSAVCLVLATSSRIDTVRWGMQFRDYLIGILLGLGIFLRLNPALPVLLLVIIGSLVYISFQTFQRLLVGSCVGILSILFILQIGGGIGAWWDQSIIFPRKLYLGILKDSGLSGLRGNIIANGVPALLAVIFLFVILNFTYRGQNPRFLRDLLRQASAFIVLLSVYWIFLSDGFISVLNPRLFLWGVVLGGILCLSALLGKLETTATETIFGYFMLVAVGLGSLIQVFPVADRRHLWWAAIPGIFLLISLIPKRDNSRAHLVGSIILVVSLMVPAYSHAKATLSETRVEMKTSNVLKGMLVSKDFYAAFDSSFSMIGDLERIHGPRAVLNLCADGLFATLGSRTIYPDPYFVYWPFPRTVWSEEKRQEFVAEFQPFMWLCSPITEVNEVVAAYNYRLIPRPKCLDDIERFNAWPLASYLAVPKDWQVLQSESVMLDRDICFNL